jgi:signal transduction histidine kinase
MYADGLLRAVTEIALEVQRARSVSEMLAIAGAGLEALDFDLAVVAEEPTGVTVRYLSQRDALRPLGAHLASKRAGGRANHAWPPVMHDVKAREGATFIEDLPQALSLWLSMTDLPLPAQGAVRQHALAAPLSAGERAWGAIIFMHDQLTPAHGGVLSLFALQLGAAIDLADHFERLNRRTAELDLVHRLAASGPQADLRALCRDALELVCRSTLSDAAVLHRYDSPAGEFELVGDAFGYEGPLVDAFRRYRLPEPNPFLAGPMSVAAPELLNGAAPVREAGFAYLAIIPLVREGVVLGILTLARQAARGYVEADLRLGEILGVQMLALLERARLSDETNRLYGDLKRSYDQLARTQAELVRHERLAALGELAAVMAHEVRNPLGVIFNSLTTLKRLLKPTGDSEMLLNMVGEEADRLNRIVGDLLDFVRPFDLAKKPIAIEPVVTSAVHAAAQSLASANVRVATEFPRELPAFPADAHLLKQALVNLVVNAVQAMPRGGVVVVRAHMEPRPEGAWLRIEVQDDGVGLTPRAAEKMFQPFFTTKATGTGLGLAVVKRIVDGHQGEITATANEGRGTTFTVRLPPGERDVSLTPPMLPAVVR